MPQLFGPVYLCLLMLITAGVARCEGNSAASLSRSVF